MRETVIEKVLKEKVIAIVRGVYDEDCLHLAQALHAGGIGLLEVTFDQSDPAGMVRTADTIALLCRELGSRMVFGAGTVTDTKMLECAIGAGARFIVSPDVNGEVIRATVEAGLVSMPGAMTPTEIQTAHRFGADFVKVFPASVLGPGYIRAVRAPLNHIRLLAVGGVNERNISDFLEAGASGVGVGGNLVNREWIRQGRFEDITALAGKMTAGRE